MDGRILMMYFLMSNIVLGWMVIWGTLLLSMIVLLLSILWLYNCCYCGCIACTAGCTGYHHDWLTAAYAHRNDDIAAKLMLLKLSLCLHNMQVYYIHVCVMFIFIIWKHDSLAKYAQPFWLQTSVQNRKALVNNIVVYK